MLKIHNPYPGFSNGFHKPYEFYESDYFFGRERDVNNIKLKLRQNKVVSILAGSSIGKTSFLKAGLIADLAKKIYTGEKGNYWRTVYLTPGKDPLISMARAIVNPQSFIDRKIKPSLEEEVLGKLDKNDYGLIRVVEDLNATKPLNVLMIIDDFNLLFSSSIEVKKQAKVIQLLNKAINSKDLGFYLITAMDKDGLNNASLSGYKDFYKLMKLGSYHLRLLDQRSLKSAIETPAKIERSEIHPDLSDRLIDELLGDEDQLRKLQLYLNRTWFEWKKNHKDKYVTQEHFKKATGQRQKAILSNKSSEKDSGSSPIENITDTGDFTLNSYESDYAGLSTAHQIAFKRIIQSLYIINDNEKAEFEPVEFRSLAKLLDMNDTEVLKIINQVPGILNVDKKYLKANRADALEKWERATKWAKEEQVNIKQYKGLADAAILHYIEGIDIESVFSKEQYEESKLWYDEFNPTEGWGLIHHEQYDLAVDLIEKLEEHYGPISKKPASGNKGGGSKSTKIKIGGKKEEPVETKQETAAGSVGSVEPEDEDAAIAALLASDEEKPVEKEKAKIKLKAEGPAKEASAQNDPEPGNEGKEIEEKKSTVESNKVIPKKKEEGDAEPRKKIVLKRK
jgi:hypothetical protein